MPPTVCLAEFPSAGSTVNAYVCRRQRAQNRANFKRQTLAMEQTLRSEIIGEIPLASRTNRSPKLGCISTVPDCYAIDKSGWFPTHTDEHYRKLVAARKDLLSIVIRTITLVRRNRILQRRVNALRAETRRFLRSVLNNPENQHCQDRLQMRQLDGDIVSSSTDKVVSLTSVLLDSDPTGNSSDSSHRVTSTYDNHDYNENRAFVCKE
ncbi:PREDICTED: uncharacterized protein LOC106747051 isoform X2 [Dinoponera quadriceps]|nr:PREDICTED: uncharacterized protein LOC106747051 isoform X2 [Dinoponera quadriceps]XP_014479781.1 PREDICTED: uncharacterized protein LOC106747051 isoform X2 [Dinoponera quadriceps]XP_014479783.1 PREDICTED: uncharacterized protein LOC106747051 isoform X2 [Dinoponera quadriceps]